MFNNLIESSSHAREFKRRGSFFLFTTITYALLFVVAGVLSIYAYDARLEEPENEITMLSPLEIAPPSARETTHNASTPRPNNDRQIPMRREAMASVDRPDLVPPTTSVARNPNLPVPDRGNYVIGAVDSNPGSDAPGNSNRSGINNGVRESTPAVVIQTPPPAPIEKPKPKVVHKSVLNGYAVSLPKPTYPPIAKQMRVQGTVTVQVLVDESGRVISAKAVSGNPVLINAAQTAAMGARFSPTMLGEQAVKVSGVITYNFVLQ